MFKRKHTIAREKCLRADGNRSKLCNDRRWRNRRMKTSRWNRNSISINFFARLRDHFELKSISTWCHLYLTSVSYGCHFNFASSSPRVRSEVTYSIPLRFHFDLTWTSLRARVDSTSISVRLHFESLRCRFDFTSALLWCHFDLKAIQLRRLFEFTSDSLWFQYEFALVPLRCHSKLTST